VKCLEPEGICSSHVVGINSSCNLYLHSVACLQKAVDKHYDMFIFPIIVLSKYTALTVDLLQVGSVSASVGVLLFFWDTGSF
jgi:hypothetical protein